jgi:hypothetical protein
MSAEHRPHSRRRSNLCIHGVFAMHSGGRVRVEFATPSARPQNITPFGLGPAPSITPFGLGPAPNVASRLPPTAIRETLTELSERREARPRRSPASSTMR